MVLLIPARLAKILFLALLWSVMAFGDSTCVNFSPQGAPAIIPFASVAYVTAANAVGDHLVVGALVGGTSGVNAVNAVIPLPSISNQLFCDAQVQLAPQQFYPNVYVPTVAERSGDFGAFAGLLVDPSNNQPFQNGKIPLNRLGAVYAWRIGPAQGASANRGWSATGSMAGTRYAHASVLLPSGKVLAVGPQATAELYDPVTGTFKIAGQTRFVHGAYLTATLLNDGRVLIVGGESSPSATELYDPVSGQFVAAGSPLQPHGYFHSATLLNDGRVLVVGGLIMPGNGGATTDTNAGAELYDPKTGVFSKTGALASNRNLHSATLLADGRVLIAGGYSKGSGAPSSTRFNTAEIFDPTSGTFSLAGPMQEDRAAHYGILLSNNKVLLGGGDSNGGSAELFDSSTARFAVTGSMNNASRAVSSVALLSSGQVLVAGGKAANNVSSNSTELYNPATGTFETTGSMAVSRSFGTATPLLDGRVLEIGGNSTQAVASAELYTPVAQGLFTSQTGLTFRAAQGGGAVALQIVAVLSSTDTIPWIVSTRTYNGGSWLKATPSSATSTPGSAPATLSISADATSLAAQDYYGAVTITPTDGKHPPVSISVVLSIVPAGSAAPPGVSPSGLVFLAASGAAVKPQSFGISNLTSKPVTFTGTGSSSPNWFDFNPKAGTINAGQTNSITVTPAITGLTAGVYRGSIKLTFGDNSTQTVDLLLVVSPTAGTVAGMAAAPEAAGCAPTKLLPVFTSIGTGFTTPAAWPTAIALQVVDDCGVSLNTGSVAVSFSNGDAPLSLLPIGNAAWTATWVPAHNSTSAFAVRADARQSSLSGSAQVTGQVSLNPKVPIVSAAGVVSSGDYSGSPALGLLVSIFGSALAEAPAGAVSLPLQQQLGSTQVLVAGTTLPLLYVSEGQINVLVPYDLAVNAPHQLIVQRGNAISVPVPIAVYDSQPAILAAGGNGSGQGAIFKIDAQGNSILADAQAPAAAGDVLVMYCVGLGAVQPAVKAGDPAPFDPSTVIAPVAVTIGGQQATVLFSGLTPGAAGLYQVNVVVPDGIMSADQVPVVLSVAGKGSAGNIYMGVK